MTKIGEYEYVFTDSPYAVKYRLDFLKEVQQQAVEQHAAVPEKVLTLMQTAYNHGFNDGGNFAYDCVTGKIKSEKT